MVQQCSACLATRVYQQNVPLTSHEVPAKPWQKVGADLFHFKDNDYLIVVDYFSNFPEVALLKGTTSSTVITHMKSIFARHGIPEIVISDNGPQFTSKEFAEFAAKWEFSHITSSPRYPKANGMAERAVQTIKKLLEKADMKNEARPLPCRTRSQIMPRSKWRSIPSRKVDEQAITDKTAGSQATKRKPNRNSDEKHAKEGKPSLLP